MKKIVLVIVSMLLFTGAIVRAQEYKVDTDKSVVEWTGKRVTAEHHGKIKIKEGTFTVKDNKIVSGKIVMDMASITNEDLTGGSKEKLVGHLKSDDFFSVANFATSTLEIKESEPFKNGITRITGILTIKNISHPVTFTVKRDGNMYSTTLAVDRTLYDIKFRSGKFFPNIGDIMIDDNFILEVKIAATI
jgi:polyisoprenoid-binding protein YceI